MLGADPEDLEIVTTARGPVFSGSVDEGSGLSLRAASSVLGDLGFDAILPLLRARTVDDVDAAFDAWVEPVNNVVAADRHGTVRYRVAGRIPVRDDGNRRGVADATDPATAWTGWLDPLPRTDVPPDGQVVTANERRGAESEPVGTTFAPPHRAQRLHDLMAGRTDLTAADFADFHGDTLLPALDQVIGPAGPPRSPDCRAARSATRSGRGTAGWTPTPRARPRSPPGAPPSPAGSRSSRCSGPSPNR